MFRIKFNDICFISNKKQIYSSKIILFFYGIGCCSHDFEFLFRNQIYKEQLIIAELPGHNNLTNYRDNLLAYSKKIYLFLKKKNIKEITLFGHSLGGIIPILLVKNFLRKKIGIKKFINYEGNLTVHDTETLTKKTISYNRNDFIKHKFSKLVGLCKISDKKFLNYWSESLQKTSPLKFYDFSSECVKLSETKELLSFFRIFFKFKVYIYGEKTKLKIPNYSFGSVRLKIKNSGHFSFFEDRVEFSRIFNQLILKKI